MPTPSPVARWASAPPVRSSCSARCWRSWCPTCTPNCEANAMTKPVSLSRVAIYATLLAACAVYLIPLVIMLLTSFPSPEDIRTGNLLSWPEVFTAIGALNGYVLAMWRFRGSQLFFGLLLFGCFLPFQVVLLPASFTIGQLGLANTTSGLVLIHVVYGMAFTTLFFRNYYVSIPDALVRAARLDGAGFFTIFGRILPPMSTPIIMVCLIWQFTQIWNVFLFGVVFASGDTQPITVALNNLVNTSTGAKEYNVDMAAAMIAGLPTLVVYVLAGKYFLRGLTAGAVKG